MSLKKKDALRYDLDSAKVLNDNLEQEELKIETWDDIFYGVFDEPLHEPKNTTIAIKRSLPPFHLENFTGDDLHIPHFFTTDDMYGDRWAFILIDLGEKNIDWTFLAFKPDKIALLEFLSGKKDLIHVYSNTPQDQFYIVRPNVSSRLLRIDPNTEFPKTAKAIPGSLYNDNIFIDIDDVEYGYNTADAKRVMEFANAGKFYFKM